MTINVTATPFTDEPGMPDVHQDDRRIITEVAPTNEAGMLDRVTRIEVVGFNVPLGHHFHDFDEAFAGTGGGTLYTAPADDPADVTDHDLPEDGWEVTIPAGLVHTFVLSRGAILVSRTDRHFVAEANQREHPDQPVNTHSVRLAV
jgi:hypothetical protein